MKSSACGHLACLKRNHFGSGRQATPIKERLTAKVLFEVSAFSLAVSCGGTSAMWITSTENATVAVASGTGQNWQTHAM